MISIASQYTPFLMSRTLKTTRPCQMLCIILCHIDMGNYGWTRDSTGKLDVVWENPENVQKAKEMINLTFSGCKCKTGCMSKRCHCKKNSKLCGPGCQCIACQNLPKSSTAVKDPSLTELEVNERVHEAYNTSKEEKVMVDDSDDEDYSDYVNPEKEADEEMLQIFDESSESDASSQSEGEDEAPLL